MRYFPSRLAMLSAIPKGSVCCEVGVLVGNFCTQILHVVDPTRLYAIDHWQGDIPWVCVVDGRSVSLTPGEAEPIFLRQFAPQIESGRVVVRKGNSVEQLALIPDNELDFVFIDAGHVYENVLADLEAAYPKVKSGGLIAGHDWCQICEFGVPRAVAVFCDRHELDLTYLTDSPQQKVMRPPQVRLHWPATMAYNSFGIQLP